jgi:prephenate dehydrogenase
MPSSRREEGEPPPFARVGIAGLGLIGGSIALAVRDLWPTSLVMGVDRPDVIEDATRRHAIDLGAEDLGVLADVDLVILAAPVRQNLRLLAQLEVHIPRATVVTDTGSTKRDIVAAAAALPDRFTFVGGHPLGGAAVGGLSHARADLFRGRPWLFTPGPAAPPQTVAQLEAFATALGSSTRVMEADQHDRMLAFLSHLPQLTASALMGVVGAAVGADGLSLAGRGLVDTTRLASSPAPIWQDIAASNADEIAPALDALIARLQALRANLGGGEQLGEIFAEAARWREQLTTRSTL